MSIFGVQVKRYPHHKIEAMKKVMKSETVFEHSSINTSYFKNAYGMRVSRCIRDMFRPRCPFHYLHLLKHMFNATFSYLAVDTDANQLFYDRELNTQLNYVDIRQTF